MPLNLQFHIGWLFITLLLISSTTVICSYDFNDQAISIGNVITILWNSILRISDVQIRDNTTFYAECASTISSHVLIKSLKNVFVSGHTFNQLGNEHNCSDPYQYYLIELQFKDSSTFSNKEEEVAKFLNISSYNLGICFWMICDNVVNKLLDEVENKVLFDNLYREYNITKLKSTKLIESEYSTGSIVFAAIVLAYFGIVVVLKILCSLFIREDIEDQIPAKDGAPNEPVDDNDDEEEVNKDKDDDEEKDKDKQNTSDDKSDLFDNKEEKSVNLDSIKKYIKEIDNEEPKGEKSTFSLSAILEAINSFYLSRVNLNTIFNAQSFLYKHPNSLKALTGIRWLIMLFFTFNNVFFIFYKTPQASTSNTNVFFRYTFLFVKLSSFAIHCWLFLDGLTYAYKLMCAVKIDQSFLSFLQFYLKNIPRIILFYICFYFINQSGKDLAVLYGVTYQFSQYYVNYFQKDCLMRPSFLLVPFKLAYYSFSSNGYEECFLFCYLFINEFYCFTLALIMFYLIYRYRSVKIDIAISIVIVANILMSYLSFLKIFQMEEAKQLSVKFVLGENLSIMFPHLMFNIFFLGNLCGIIYYYYELSINDIDHYLSKEVYFPFAYCNTVMKLLSKQNKEKTVLSYVLNIVSLGLIVFICMAFPIYMKYSTTKGRTILFDFTLGIRILYVYERYIFILLIGFLVLQMLLAGQNAFTKLVTNTKIFISFERISFSYMCLCELFVALFLTLFELQGLNWNYLTIIYITFALFVLVYGLSLIITVLFEYPFKFLVKVYGKLVETTPDPRKNSFFASQGLIPQ